MLSEVEKYLLIYIATTILSEKSNSIKNLNKFLKDYDYENNFISIYFWICFLTGGIVKLFFFILRSYSVCKLSQLFFDIQIIENYKLCLIIIPFLLHYIMYIPVYFAIFKDNKDYDAK